jgi:BirA family biotin operon repressor/biotin-[acetyl-CoA-carboxylase] ligase
MSANCLNTSLILQETFVARIEHHATIGSTNDRAAQAVANGAGELPLLVVADEQTAGRGRGGNRWWTGTGSLAMSLVIAAPSMQNRSPIAALATAVAVVETVAPLLPDRRVGLHWPNDVLVDERKLAGILIEVLADGRHIVGIGVNTNNSLAAAPPQLQQRAATLRDFTGRTHDQTLFVIDLLRRLERGYADIASAPEAVAAQANALCLQHGRTLTVQLGDGQVVIGQCRGIAADGALLLDTSAGEKIVYSGVLQKTPTTN